MQTVSVNGQNLPVGNIFCIGRNYAEHIKELQNATPAEPVVFLKPTAALLASGGTIVLPPFSGSVHHECELVVYIGRDADCVSVADALSFVGGYGVGLDLTARDVQSVCKEKGLPWTKAKGFRTAACVSHFIAPKNVGDIQQQSFSLRVNGTLSQQGNSADMMYSIAEIIAYLSEIYGLQAGDLVFTGTPSGVAELHGGDTLELEAFGQIRATFDVAAA